MAPFDSKPSRPSAQLALEHQHQQAVGGADGQQVEHDRLDRDDERAERDQQQQERRGEHEREHVGQVADHGVVEVAGRGGLSGGVGLDSVHLAERGRDELVAQRVGRLVRQLVGAAPVVGSATVATVWSLLTSSVALALEQARTLLGLVSSESIAETTLGGGHVVGLDHDHLHAALAGEGGLDAVVGLHHRDVTRGVVDAAQRASAFRSPAPRARPARWRPRAAESSGRRSTRSRMRDQMPASPTVFLMRPTSGSTTLVDAVAELREQRRQHRQRADHRDCDDHDRAGRKRGEIGDSAQVHAGHRDHHGETGDHHRTTRGRRSGLDRGVRCSRPAARSSRALFR